MSGTSLWSSARLTGVPTSDYLPNMYSATSAAPPDFSSIGDWASGQTVATPAMPLASFDQGPATPWSMGGMFKGFGDALKGSGFLGSTDTKTGMRTDGWGGAAFSAASGLMNGWLGMKQYGLFKEQLAQSKKQFDLNFEANRKLTNSRLEDRQRTRVAANPGLYESPSTYMQKYGI